MDGSRPEQAGGRPKSLGDAWSELKDRTLRKTGPQLLLAVWFWGLVLGASDLVLRQHLGPAFAVALGAGLVFYSIVIARVIGVLPRRPFAIVLAHLWLLVVGYTL